MKTSLKNKKLIKCKSRLWGRYRYRLFKRYEDSARDFNAWKIICFKHRVDQSVCHCDSIDRHFKVTPKIAIPKKNNIKRWLQLEKYLKDFGDFPEHVYTHTFVPFINLTKREKLLYNFFGITPDVGYVSNIHMKLRN